MNIMVIVAHPDLNYSELNKAMAAELAQHSNIHVRDLYKEYPNWQIDVDREQRLLLEFDRIVFQFPLYWYSCPPLLKKWFDDVLTFGWAFGPGGDHLRGKEFVVATTTGGEEKEYRAGGRNWFTLSEYLRPIQGTLSRCNGAYLPAFVSYSPSPEELPHEVKRYVQHIMTPMTALAQ